MEALNQGLHIGVGVGGASECRACEVGRGGGASHVALHGGVVDGHVEAGADGSLGGGVEAALLEDGADPARHEEVARGQLHPGGEGGEGRKG